MSREGFDKYVIRILKDKGLTPTDVERRSAGGISDSYVALITAGKVKNISVDKLKALARGLGVSEDEVFTSACGVTIPKNEEFHESEFVGLFYKYSRLADVDKREVRAILEIVDREIDRRLVKNDTIGVIDTNT
ncbi:MAG TPA: helix-turn-helix transcriptional regulator [Blastocatellia bacterium]|nr:helix-turn-helix transcriptional regulator [Blastocatellia bacterium]